MQMISWRTTVPLTFLAAGFPAVAAASSAEALALETPVVERREMSATGWHYVAQNPYLSIKLGKEGRLAWTFSAPAPLKDMPFSLWIRARRAEGASQGRVSIQAGATAASASAASENWTWVRAGDDAGKPARFAARDGRIDAALTLRNHSIEIDSLAWTTDANGRPRPEGAVDNAPPQPPKDLRAAKADSGAILLSWCIIPNKQNMSCGCRRSPPPPHPKSKIVELG